VDHPGLTRERIGVTRDAGRASDRIQGSLRAGDPLMRNPELAPGYKRTDGPVNRPFG